MRLTFRAFAALVVLHLTPAWALEIPPPPQDFVYDQTGTIDSGTRQRLFDLLSGENRRTGNQVVVAVFPSLAGEDLVDFTNRLFKAWNPGQKEKNNGVLLAFYMQDRKVRIEVGYGLEPILTDAISRRIIETEIVPAFRQGEYGTGIYQGAARTIQTIQDPTTAPSPVPAQTRRVGRPIAGSAIFIFFILFLILRSMMRSVTYSRHGSRYGGRGGGLLSGLLLGSLLGGRRRGGGGWGGGGFGGGGGWGGGGGFSGGGGSSGGGGASGSW
jgi:uncharacterized protein